MQPSFPFSAIVGQENLKRALLLGVIQPSLGGVLIRGTKGVAKSTAVRALVALLPPIESVAGCPFQRELGEEIPDWPLPAAAARLIRPVPLVELPLGATEDRVLGSLHLEKALRGERAFEPGLLASANRGILYIDEVNLLPDHLVDILLDAAASGIHRVEREGLSLCHPAQFVLIGTMNPEEGDLRPQLLDRFGLVVDVADLNDPADRAEAVRRRLAYEHDPAAFVAGWNTADVAEAERLVQARRLLPKVRVSAAVLQAVSERCVAEGVEGLRADLTLGKAASAWAAYQGRGEVEPGDVDMVAELALAHRRTRPPEPPEPRGGVGRDGETQRRSDAEMERRSDGETQRRRDREARGEDSSRRSEDSGIISPCLRVSVSPSLPPSGSDALIFESAGLFRPQLRPSSRTLARSTVSGRWRSGQAAQLGPALGPVRAGSPNGSALAWAATLRAAAPYQIGRGRGEAGGRMILQAADLRMRPRRGPAGCLLLFVVDASGSMAAWQRMRQTKAAVLALLLQAYQRRDRVALLAFRGGTADVVLPPARGLHRAWRALEELAVGGTTPLAHGLAAACRLIRGQQRRQPGQPIWTVLLTDGRANVATTSTDPWQDALAQARALAACRTDCLVVDTETGWPRFGRSAELAGALQAPWIRLEEVLGKPLPDHRRRAM